MAEVTAIAYNLRNCDHRTPRQQVEDIETLAWGVYNYLVSISAGSVITHQLGKHFEIGRGGRLVVSEQSKNISGEESLRWFQLRYNLVVPGLHWQNVLNTNETQKEVDEYTLEEDGLEIIVNN